MANDEFSPLNLGNFFGHQFDQMFTMLISDEVLVTEN